MSKLKYIIIILILFFSFNKIVKNIENKKESSLRSQKPETFIVQTILTQYDSIENSILINGKLGANLETIISSQIDGQIKNTFKEMGDIVKKDELLATIDDLEYEARQRQALTEYLQIANKLSIDINNLEKNINDKLININSFNIYEISTVKKAKINVDNIKKNLWRINQLEKNQLTSKQALDDLESKLKIAETELQIAIEEAKNLILTFQNKKAALDITTKKLTDTKIKAPFDGIILKRNVSNGEYVKVGTPIFTILQINPIKFLASVSENYANDISIGKKIIVFIDSLNETYEAYISRISPISNIETHSFDIEALIENSNYKLKPGYFANAKILINQNKSAILLPNDALYSYAGINKVFVIKNNRCYERKIKIGKRFVDKFEVSEGLFINELVAVSNVSKLYDNANVKIENEKK